MVGGNALDAASVGGGADRRDTFDERLERILFSRSGSDDAVAVELRVGEDLHLVGGIRNADFVLLELEVGENLLRGILQGGAFRILRIEGIERNDRISLEQEVGILDDLGEPLGRCDDLVDADLAVAVGVEVGEALRIKFEPRHRAAEHRPELAVEFAEMGDVLAAGNLHPDLSANGSERPLVAVVFLFLLAHRYDDLNIFSDQSRKLTKKL